MRKEGLDGEHLQDDHDETGDEALEDDDSKSNATTNSQDFQNDQQVHLWLQTSSSLFPLYIWIRQIQISLLL